MLSLSGIVNSMKIMLESKEELSDLTFIVGFTGADKPSPLTKNYVALGIDGAKEVIKDVYSEDETPVLLFNRFCTARIRLDIFVPETSNGIECYKIFTRLSNYIMELSTNYDFAGAGCDTITYERDEGAFVLSAYIDVEQYSLK